MEKKQYELCLKVLKRLDKAGILDNFVLIGSWCVYFYKEYFAEVRYIDLAAIRTRDIDLLIDNPAKMMCDNYNYPSTTIKIPQS